MTEMERNRFLYETKELVPHLRQKLAIYHAEKALDLDDWHDYVKFFGLGEEEEYE